MCARGGGARIHEIENQGVLSSIVYRQSIRHVQLRRAVRRQPAPRDPHTTQESDLEGGNTMGIGAMLSLWGGAVKSTSLVDVYELGA